MLVTGGGRAGVGQDRVGAAWIGGTATLNGSAAALAVLPDGRVVSGGSDGLVLVWDLSQPERDPVKLGRPSKILVTAVAALADGRVVSGRSDGRVFVWDPSQPGSDPVTFDRHDRLVTAVAVLPDGWVVSGGLDQRVLVWDPSQPGRDPVELGRYHDRVTAVAVLPDGRVVTGGHDRQVFIWNATTQRRVAQLGCSVIGLAVQASRDEASLVVVHQGQGFSLWSITEDDQERPE
jgi:WD40 repeat protein